MTLIGTGAVGGVAVLTAVLGRARARSRPAGQVLPARQEQPTVDRAPAAQGQFEPVVLITRDQWGAKAPSVSPGRRGENGPYSADNPNGWRIYDLPLEDVLDAIIIHHSALPLSDGPIEIQRLHMEEKGFADVGYQYIIDENGKLYEGRPLNVRGAHTYGNNYGSVGVCLIGNFEEIQPSPAQFNALHALIKALLNSFPNISSLAGHKDYNTGVTLCPGQNLYPQLDEIARQHNLRYGV